VVRATQDSKRGKNKEKIRIHTEKTKKKKVQEKRHKKIEKSSNQ
jgi:hypothetical protein